MFCSHHLFWSIVKDSHNSSSRYHTCDQDSSCPSMAYENHMSFSFAWLPKWEERPLSFEQSPSNFPCGFCCHYQWAGQYSQDNTDDRYHYQGHFLGPLEVDYYEMSSEESLVHLTLKTKSVMLGTFVSNETIWALGQHPCFYSGWLGLNVVAKCSGPTVISCIQPPTHTERAEGEGKA